jgi:integrase
MRRSGSIRERSPGHFELRYSLGTDPATGQRRTANVAFQGSQKDAERELRRLLRSLDTGEHIDPNRIILREWFASWLGAVRSEVSPRTHERYGEIVAHFLAPALGNVPIAKLAPSQIQAFYNELAVGGRRDGKPGGLSPRTRQHVHRVLHAALTRAVEQQLLARNPAAVFRRRLPKVERAELAVLTAVQAHRLLAVIRHHRVYWPVMIALATGARRGEILALRWRHVDLDRGVVRIVESLEHTRAGVRFKPPKSGKARAVTLPGFALDELSRRSVPVPTARRCCRPA